MVENKEIKKIHIISMSIFKRSQKKFNSNFFMTIMFVFILFLIGCLPLNRNDSSSQQALSTDAPSQSSSDKQSNSSSSLSSENSNNQKNDVAVSEQIFKNTFYDEEDKQKILDVNITLPYLTQSQPSSAVRAINAFYEQQFNEMKNNVTNQFLIDTKKDKSLSKEQKTEFMPYAYESEFSISYLSKDYISIIHTSYVFTGGAHPNMFLRSETFDLYTGKRVFLTDFIKGTKEQALDKIYQFIEEQIKQTKGSESFVYYDTYENDIREYFAEEDFVLQKDSMMVFYQQYAIAPYATGFQMFEIPYQQKQFFLEDLTQK